MSGLADVIACDSTICSIEDGVLRYRGYAIEELAAHASFEEVTICYGMDGCPN
jgi:citrate synthase